MYALWGSGLDTVLRAPGLHARLAAVGAAELQVNVADADVAAAELRISTYAAPVAAIVSVWTGTDSGPITEILREVAERVNGWIVTERIPLALPPIADGQRVDALSNIALLRRPEHLTGEQWRTRWHEHHTAVAIEVQGTIGYVQNTVVAAVTRGPRVDGLVEELFPMAAISDRHVFWGSGGDDTELQRRMAHLRDSIGTFGADRDLDVVPTSRYRYALR
jgi:hypothetical protein